MNQAFSANRQASRYSGMPWRARHRFNRFDIGHRYRLAAAGIIGHRQHHQRDFRGAFRGDQRLQRGHVHVALEIQPGLRVGGLRNGQVHRPRAGEFDIGARGIEMRVVRTTCPGLHITVNRMRSAARPW